MRRHVVVAEDSRTQARAVRSQLEGAGYEVTVCADGLSALEAARGADVDAVVSDVVMPGLNGYELCSRIKGDPDLARLPVLLLTSLRDPLDVVHALEAGADGFLTKPAPADQLTARLGALLEGRARSSADGTGAALDVLFMGHRVSVSAERQQVVDVLMSSFEELIRSNRVLHQRESELAAAHQQLARHLQESDEARLRLERSLALSAVGAWEFDLDSGSMLWWENVEPLYGSPVGGLGRELSDLLERVHPDDHDRVRELLAADADRSATAADDPTVEEFDYRVVHPSGTVRWLRLHYAVTAERRLVGVAFDVTSQVVLQQQLAEARDEAERANRAKSEFLSRMSHELRTPLNAILGFGQLLTYADGLQEEDRSGVEHLLVAGRHLVHLIDEVLDISRIESGDAVVELEPVDVRVAVTESLQMVRGLAAEREVSLRTGSSDARCATADRRRLHQVLINLLSNAVKYNRAGGEVEARWERTDDACVVVEVRDTGTGIAPEQLERLFVPFDRLGAEASGIEGTGLGLSLSRHLVELMGGRLDVRSEVGRGSVFTVTLPAADAEERTACGPTDAAEETSSVRGTIVYIEDNASNVQLMERVLRRRPDVELLAAPDGWLGTELVRERRPDLVLLDLQLPGRSGYEVLEDLRADESLTDVHVVVVTADLSDGRAEQLRALGADGLLPKPFELRDLLELVDTTLGGHDDVRT